MLVADVGPVRSSASRSHLAISAGVPVRRSQCSTSARLKPYSSTRPSIQAIGARASCKRPCTSGLSPSTKPLEKRVDSRQTRVALTQGRLGDGHLNIDPQEQRNVLSVGVCDVSERSLACGLGLHVQAALVVRAGEQPVKGGPTDEATWGLPFELGFEQRAGLLPIADDEHQRELATLA